VDSLRWSESKDLVEGYAKVETGILIKTLGIMLGIILVR